jgi:hypothetical protein
MTVGFSLCAIAVGAILKFAITTGGRHQHPYRRRDPDGGRHYRPDRQPVDDPGRPRRS